MRKIKNECFYCEKNSVLKNKMTLLMELRTTTVYLNNDQTYFGRSIVALNNHEDELYNLDSKTRFDFIEDVSKTAKIIQKITKADKINYAIFGDVVSHLHVHLVPKWKEKEDWDKGFINQPQHIKKISNIEFENFKLEFRNLMINES